MDPSREAAGGTTERRIDEASAVKARCRAGLAVAGSRPATKAAIVRLEECLASAIPGRGGEDDPGDSQPAWGPVPAQVAPTGAGAPWWPPASIAAIPIKPVGSLVAGPPE